MKQEFTLRIYKADKRITKAEKRGSLNKIGLRCIGSYQFQGRDDAGMVREVRELMSLYPLKEGHVFEYFPTYKTVVNLMTGSEVQIKTETPASCDPSTETYWSM